MKTKALALLAGVALSATAFADEAVVVAPAADQAVVVETAKLDTDVVLTAASAGGFSSMFASKAVVTGLIFAGVSVATFVATTNGDPLGVSPGHQ